MFCSVIVRTRWRCCIRHQTRGTASHWTLLRTKTQSSWASYARHSVMNLPRGYMEMLLGREQSCTVAETARRQWFCSFLWTWVSGIWLLYFVALYCCDIVTLQIVRVHVISSTLIDCVSTYHCSGIGSEPELPGHCVCTSHHQIMNNGVSSTRRTTYIISAHFSSYIEA